MFKEYKVITNKLISKMKRKIFVLGAFITALFTFNGLNAQDFEKNEVHLFAEDNPVGDRMVIKQGEIKRLCGYVSVISEQQAQNNKKAKHAMQDSDNIYQKLGSDITDIMETPSNDKSYLRDDTLYIVADSVALEMYSEQKSDTRMHNSYGIFLYKDGENVHAIGDYSTHNPNSDIPDATDRLIDAVSDYFDTKAERKKWHNHKRTLSTGMVYGYGYLNYSDNGLFSTPSSNDPYSLKWSDKWDVMFRFTFFPDNAVSLTTGIGIQSNVFRFDDGFDIYPYAVATPASGFSKEKCKLVARYITVPLLADFHIANHFNIHAGFIGGLNYRNSHTGFKRNYKVDGEKIEQSTGSSFKEFSTFKADAMFGVELYGWTFYVSHSLTGMFKDSYGKDLMPFSFGVLVGL